MPSKEALERSEIEAQKLLIEFRHFGHMIELRTCFFKLRSTIRANANSPSDVSLNQPNATQEQIYQEIWRQLVDFKVGKVIADHLRYLNDFCRLSYGYIIPHVGAELAPSAARQRLP